MSKRFLAFIIAVAMMITMLPLAASAEGEAFKKTVGETESYTNSLSYTTSNGTCRFDMLRDATISRTCWGGTFTNNMNVVVDLGGYTLTCTASSNFDNIYFHSGMKNSTVTFQNGTVILAGDNNGFGVQGTNNTLVLGDDLTVVGGTTCPVVIFGDGNTVTTAADISVTDDFAIATNGSDTANSTINVTGGSIVSTGEVAIYNPSGDLNISGGSITGSTAVYVKSGVTSITGGTITGNGPETPYQYWGSGCYSTGDAIVIDNCGYPAGDPFLKISGGTIVSDNALAVGSYAYGEGRQPIRGFAMGGLYSSEITVEDCASGYVPGISGDYYTVDVVPATLRDLLIASKPTKQVYLVGERLDLTGLVVTLDDVVIPTDALEIEGFDSSYPNTTVVNVHYHGLKRAFSLKVVAGDQLRGIRLASKPSKLVYTVGESVSKTGMEVYARYYNERDGEREVKLSNISVTINGIDKTQAGLQTAVATYQGATARFTVRYNEAKSLIGITISSKPAKLVYAVGEEIDTTGLAVKAYYSDGTNEIVTDGLTASLDTASAGVKKATVSLGNYTASFSCRVR